MATRVDSTDVMGTAPLGRLLLRFSLPPIVGMLVNATYNVVDRVFIGQGVGSLGLAGVTIGFPIPLLMGALSILVGGGANALFSIRMGEGRKEEAERILGNAFILLLILPGIASIFALWKLDALLTLMGASAEVLPFARDYSSIILLGSAINTAGFGLTHFIRSDGHPKTAMVSQLIGGGANVVLDPIFIFGLGMGVKGAALATIISQTFSFVWCLAYFLSKRANTALRRRDMRLDFHGIVRPFLWLGTPSFLMSLCNGAVSLVLNRGCATYGDQHYGLAAMGIISAFGSITFMPTFGITQGAQPLMGYNYGAKKYDRLRRLFYISVACGTAMMCAGFIIAQCFPHWVVFLFAKNEPQVLLLGTHALRLFSIAMPCVAISIMGSTLFQSTGHPLEGTILTLTRQVFLFIPFLLVFPLLVPHLGLEPIDGIYLAAPASDLSAACLSFFLIRRVFRKISTRDTTESVLVPESV